ncbi:MAG: DUF2238 domain-containing protein [Elusimicrobiaceae bacterium]|nr:DUF2238 domain-containing protein [Elusimicrobiaceae bacterium]
MKKYFNFPLVLLCIWFLEFLWSYFYAYDVNVWYVEISSVVFAVLLLSLTYKKFRFSNLAYFIVFLWIFLHTIGACYTFERVPFLNVMEFFGIERNNFDRFAHFIIGISSFLACEFVYRKHLISSLKFAAFFGIIFIMALANFWELLEWIYAVVDGGDVGLAFLGSQGDIWDAQKDMLMDTLGACLGSIIFFFKFRKSSAR